MNNGMIYDFVSLILRKEKEGSAVSPERFTLLLIESMWEKLNVEFGKFEESQVVTDTLRNLKVSEDIAIPGTGVFDLTTLTEDYLHPTTIFYTDTGSRIRQVDIVTDAEWAEYMSKSLTTPTAEFPIAKISGDDLIFSPLATVTATITYLKNPTEPFYDYYYDVDERLVYLTEGQSYALQAGEEYRDGTVPPATVNSVSVELPFPENERISVAYQILQKFGIPVQEVGAVQYGAQREAKEEML